MSKILTAGYIARLSIMAADRLGIELPSRNALFKRLKHNQNYPLPLIMDGNGYRIWIDLLYIAYSADDEADVHYIYVTEAHIKEEIQSYSFAETRSKTTLLPENIRVQFAAVKCKMAETGKKYHIFDTVLN